MQKNNKGWEIDLLPVIESSKSADCILLRFGDLFNAKENQNVFIIDGGFSETAQSVKEHLKKYYNCYWNGKYHITCAFLTHTDLDHISGLVSLFEDEEVEINNLVTNVPWKNLTPKWFNDGRITKDSLIGNLEDAFGKLYRLVTLAEEQGCKLFLGVDNLNGLNCGDAKIHILGPTKTFYNTCMANCEKTREQSDKVEVLDTTQVSSTGNEIPYIKGKMEWPEKDSTSPINESILVFVFEFDGVKILFTGDAGRRGLEEAFEYADEHCIELKDVAIIKIPHHGSRHNVYPELFDRFTATSRTCYISCSAEEEGHHPSKMLVNMLNEKGFRVLTTSGSTLHRSKNAPDRGWSKANPVPSYSKIEELEQ